jgi:hypothetical protein
VVHRLQVRLDRAFRAGPRREVVASQSFLAVRREVMEALEALEAPA